MQHTQRMHALVRACLSLSLSGVYASMCVCVCVCPGNINELFVMPSLHLRSLAQYCGRNRARYHAVFTYLGHHVAQGSQGKYNICRCHQLYRGRYRVNFANVNDPLILFAHTLFTLT